MKRYFFLFIFLFCSFHSLLSQDFNRVEWLRKHVYTLAHDSMRGRNAGSKENLVAAHYIVNQFQKIGIKPFFDSTYFQDFFIHTNVACLNIIGIIEGSDSLLKNEYIIIGAHFDHIGYKLMGDSVVVYNGADDNASGTAALIELARMLKEKEGFLKRSVLLVAFDAEEQGLYGSKHLATQMPIENITLMVSMDMIGYLKKSKQLYLKGVATIKNGKKLIESIEKPEHLTLQTERFELSVFGATDTEPFAKLKVPTLHLTTGLKSPYHKPEDDADRIDYVGLALITEFMLPFVEEFANNEKINPSGKLSPKHDKDKTLFQWGVVANIGESSLFYSKSAFRSGKRGFAFAGGMFMQFNFKSIAIRPEFLYENKSFYFPSTLQYSSDPVKINTQAVTLPLSLLLKLEFYSNTYFYVGLGGYYSYYFQAVKDGKFMDFSNETYRHHAGIQTSLGVNVHHINMSVVFRNELTPALKHSPIVRNEAVYCLLSYSF